MRTVNSLKMNAAKTSTISRLSLTTQIKQRGLELGFDKIGVVSALALGEELDHLEEWLHRGYHGEMPYLARDPDQRTDPRKLFPDAHSVIVVALNYYTDHEHEVRTASVSGRVNVPSKATGKVSRYAWGDDYHDVVGEKLRELLTWIKGQYPNVEGKVCVDIQPMMDKAWAVRGGLGWMGKHTNVITPEFGSWVFIGELLLNLDLAYDKQEIADQCGSCTLCIDACPTSAIVEPYLLDANLCISHATIESRANEMREDIAAHLEGWLYGCDICQDVCPWNHTPKTTNESRFEPRDGNINPSLDQILELDQEAYANRFRGSAMRRAKLAGLQRNARALLTSS